MCTGLNPSPTSFEALLSVFIKALLCAATQVQQPHIMCNPAVFMIHLGVRSYCVPTKQSCCVQSSPEGPSFCVGVNRECSEEPQEGTSSSIRSVCAPREPFCVAP